MESGYVAIGMDHFSLEEDEITQGYRNKTLQRNFQGYSLKLAEEMLSFGASSIGFTQRTYIQNFKDITSYYHALDQNLLPIHRGRVLSEDDLLRKWVIHTLMCDFELDKRVFATLFSLSFDIYFNTTLPALVRLEEDGLLVNTPDKIRVTPLGELFVRIIASTFDAYLGAKPSEHPKFSHSI